MKPLTISADQHGVPVQQFCPNATEVVRRLQQAGYEAYIVGGSVRDLLLGKVPKDFDVATDATPEEVKVVFPRAHLIGRRFRLAHVRLGGVLVEVATFRAEQAKSSDTHESGRILRDNVWGTLEEDAARRDFTINALFMDPVSGDIRDFTGGYEDLSNRCLRLIGDPLTRYREDAVRLLRAARFVAKLGVEPHPDTGAPIAELAPLLEDIPPARLFEEMCKLFLTGHGTRTLEALQRFGLTRVMLPLLRATQDGKAETGTLLWAALKNTDQRVEEEKSVTPAFLFAALLWQPVEERAAKYMEGDMTPLQALERAGDEVIGLQVRRTAIPRRFSAVTRQIWEIQARFTRTRGKRVYSVLRQPRFRAAYDFLLLRAEQDESLHPLAEFWTEAQKGQPAPAHHSRRKRRPRRRSRNRKPAAGNN
ncbi:MAG: polynucleotide adenylyltransferase PcnB [Xanthomonadales bacterium]|nr:polynucleotide adenylyltransferase PcnB [Xanthomonadales bacterium]NNL95489.1 polynucleotide adenylyltransferase PcnB [Xanthomonadales bacterium]